MLYWGELVILPTILRRGLVVEAAYRSAADLVQFGTATSLCTQREEHAAGPRLSNAVS